MISYWGKTQEYWMLGKALGGESVTRRILLVVRLLWIPIRKRIFGREPCSLTLTFNSRDFVFSIRDAADIAVLKEVFIDREYQLPIGCAPNKIVDIGSHIGVSVAFWVCSYPGICITAYEPDPENFALLSRNVLQFEGVTAIQAAVTAVSGEVVFYKNTISSISSSVISRGGNEEKICVRSESIQDILRDRSIDLVKFDIEGEEYGVFASHREAIQAVSFIGEVHYDLMLKSREDFLALFPTHEHEERFLSPQRSIILMHPR